MRGTVFSTFLVRHGWTIAAGLLVAVVYAGSLSIMPKNVFWMPDEGAKLFQLEASGLSWKEGMTYRIPFAGQRLLPGYEFLPGFDVFPEPITTFDGSLYLGFDSPAAFPLLTAPFYHAFGAAGLYIVPAVCGCLIAIVTGVMASWFAAIPAPVAVLLVGLGTPVWFYSVVFWEHTLATLVGLIAVGLLVYAPRRIESIAAAIPLILAASMFRTELPALGAALGVAWIVVAINGRPAEEGATIGRPRPPVQRWSVLLLTLVLTVALAVALDSFLTHRHKAVIRVLPERIDQAVSGITNLPQGMFEVFINSQNLGPEMGSAWNAAAILAVLLALSAPLIRTVRTQAVAIVAALSLILACSTSLIITGDPYRGLHGLIPVAPFVLLSPLALRGAWRRHDAALLALGTAAAAYPLFVFAALSLTYIHKGLLDVGMEWGQRYMLTVYPLLTILSLVGLGVLRTPSRPAWLRTACVTLFALLAAAGVCLELRGMRMLYGTRNLMAEWDRAMRSEGPIVTTVWWIAPTVADLFLSHEMFFTWQPGVARWVELARHRGVGSFTLAHTEPITDEELGVAGIHRESDTRMVTGGLLLTRFRIDSLAAQ